MQLMRLQKDHSWKRPLEYTKGGRSLEMTFSLATKKLSFPLAYTKLKEKEVELNLRPLVHH